MEGETTTAALPLSAIQRTDWTNLAANFLVLFVVCAFVTPSSTRGTGRLCYFARHSKDIHKCFRQAAATI
jgi:hypothetical protein